MLLIRLTIFLILPLLVLTAVLPSYAQTQRPERELEKFDQEFERVRELVESFGNDQARQLLTEAKALRDEAEQAWGGRRNAEAQAKLKAAYAKLEAAARLALNGTVNRWKSRLEELFRRAEHEVLGCNQSEAQRILQEAKNSRDKAERAVTAGDVRAAIEHFRVTETLLNRALKMVQSFGETVQEERQRFEILRDRATTLIDAGSDSRAQRIFDQALKLYDSAEEALASCKIEAARRFYNQGVMLLLRAMDLSKGNSQDAVKQADVALFRLREELDKARDCVDRTGSTSARSLFEQGRQLVRKAEAAIEKGHNYEAMWQIQLAQNMLRRACRIGSGGTRANVSGRIARGIENTRSDIAEARSTMSPGDDPNAAALINMADVSLRRAEEAAEAGLGAIALQGVLISQRFLTKAKELAGTSDTDASPEASRERAVMQLRRLDEAISEADNKLGFASAEWNMRFLNAARELRKYINESIQQGNYRAAEEAIQVGFELVRKSLKNISQE